MILESGSEYGKRLTAAREKMGITIEEVSYELKINLSTLKRLESSDSENLPKPGFTKGFIKAYCKFLKISPELILDEYKKTLDICDDKTVGSVLVEASEPKDFFILDFLKDKFFPLILFASVIVSVFILYSLLGNYEKSHTAGAEPVIKDKMIEINPDQLKDAAWDIDNVDEEKETESETVSFDVFDEIEPAPKTKEAVVRKEAKTKIAPIVADAKPEEVVEIEKPKYVPPKGKHRLVVEPLAETHLYIKTSLDTRPIRAKLVPEKVRTFRFDQAEVRFVDAGAVNLILDGNELGAIGIFGEEKKIEFPSLKEL